MGDREYIENFARTLANQLGIRVMDYQQKKSPQEVVRKVVYDAWPRICEDVRHQDKRTLGRLMSYGLGVSSTEKGVKLVEVHDNLQWLTITQDGMELLRQAACTAVAAAIADNIWEELERRRKIADDYLKKQAEAFERGRDPEGHGWQQSQE